MKRIHKRHISPLSAIFLALLLMISKVVAEPYQFVAISIESSTPDKLAKELHLAVTTAAGIDSTVTSLSDKGARNTFYRGGAIAMQDRKCDNHERVPVLRSRPYATLVQYLISNKGQAPINNLKQLRGKSIAFSGFQDYRLPSAYALQHMDIKLFYARNHTSLIKMLINKRIDAILASPNILEVIAPELFQRENFSFDRSKPFYKSQICYLVQDTEEGKILVGKLNRGILALEQKHKLKGVAYLNQPAEAGHPFELKTPLIQDLEAFEQMGRHPH